MKGIVIVGGGGAALQHAIEAACRSAGIASTAMTEFSDAAYYKTEGPSKANSSYRDLEYKHKGKNKPR